MACNVHVGLVASLGLLLVLPGGRAVRADDPSLARNEQRLEQMSDAEKSEFLRKKHRFDELTVDEKEHLRRLYSQFQADPDHDRLLAVLRRYANWLKTLPPGERAQLLSLPADQRVRKIKEIQQTREAQRFRMMVDGRLGREDMRSILKWVDQYTRDHRDAILANLPNKFHPSKDMSPNRLTRFLGFILLRYSKTFDLSAEDEKQLRGTISRDAQQFLDKLDSEDERSRVLRTWIRAALFSRMRPPIDPESLRKFALNRLKPAQREYLESLPRDQMLRELQNLYWSEVSHGPNWRRRGRPGPGFGPLRPGGKRPLGPPGLHGPPAAGAHHLDGPPRAVGTGPPEAGKKNERAPR